MPDAILGFDPAPADPSSLARLSDGVHRMIRGLVEARSSLDTLATAGSLWDSALGAPVVALVRRNSLRMGEVEEALLGCRTALDGWRVDVERRQAQVGNLVELVADLGPEDGAEARRAQLVAQARGIASEHDRGARALGSVFEEVSATCERLARLDGDLAEEVEAALRALAAAVEQWVEVEGPELVRTAAALGEVAALTTVISELVGIAALDGAPEHGPGVRDIVSRSPGAHRLIRALQQTWLEVAPMNLPEATFALGRRGDLAETIAGRLAGAGDPVGPPSDAAR
ncbi:MAG: hypothetical protein WKF54_01185 [Nocardioidaceae bacterium]